MSYGDPCDLYFGSRADCGAVHRIKIFLQKFGQLYYGINFNN